MQASPGAALLVHDYVREGGGGGIADDHSGNVHPLVFQPLHDQPPVSVRADFCREARIQAEPAGAMGEQGRPKSNRTQSASRKSILSRLRCEKGKVLNQLKQGKREARSRQGRVGYRDGNGTR